MARSKEVTLVALDVGPSMHGALDDVSRALRGLIATKILQKPAHEVALILFGTTGTNNDLNREMDEAGDPGQYQHIVTAHGVCCPDMDFLSTVSALPHGHGAPDFVDALTVALDLLTRTITTRPDLDARRILKRVVLISDFATEIKEVDPDFVAAIVGQLQERDCLLDVVDIACQESNAASRSSNMDTLSELLGQVRNNLRSMKEAADVVGAFRARDVSATAWFVGNLHIAGDVDIAVKVTKKASKEGLPSTGLYSDRSSAPESTHAVTRDVEVRSTADPDRLVAPEERIRAYKYGRQFVPVDRDAEAVLSYAPEKGLEVVGIVKRGDELPRHIFLKDSWVCAPEKGNERAVVALSAIARALDRKKTVAVLRWVARSTYGVSLMAATPLLGRLGQPDCLLLNHLPFKEDIRTARFAGFESKEELIPSKEQVTIMRDLVRAFDLHDVDQRERLRPEGTANPVLHRMIDYFGARALDPELPVPSPDQDTLVAGILRPQPELHPSVPALLAALPDVFPMKAPRAREGDREAADIAEPMETEEDMFTLGPAPVTHVEMVSTADPLGDFDVVMESAGAEAAVNGLQAAIERLLETSVGERNYDKAVSCLAPLRAAAVKHERAQPFNDFVRRIEKRFGPRSGSGAFWRRAVAAGSGPLGLITEEEALEGVPKAEAEVWMRDHVFKKPKVEVRGAVAPVEEEDELAGLE